MTFRKTSGVQIRGLNPVGSGLYWNELIHNEQRLHPYSPLALRPTDRQAEVFVGKDSSSYNVAFAPCSARVDRLAPAGKAAFFAKYDTPRRETRRHEAAAEMQKQAQRQ